MLGVGNVGLKIVASIHEALQSPCDVLVDYTSHSAVRSHIDLSIDAAALVDALGGGPAHLAGIGVGGMVAQVAALDHPRAFSALTLAAAPRCTISRGAGCV